MSEILSNISFFFCSFWSLSVQNDGRWDWGEGDESDREREYVRNGNDLKWKDNPRISYVRFCVDPRIELIQLIATLEQGQTFSWAQHVWNTKIRWKIFLWVLLMLSWMQSLPTPSIEKLPLWFCFLEKKLMIFLLSPRFLTLWAHLFPMIRVIRFRYLC